MNQYIDQNDFNRQTGQTAQSILSRTALIAYDIMKWFIDFVTTMVNMFLGKY